MRRCNVASVHKMISAECDGFHVLPVPKFYAFPFWESAMFFKPGQLAHAQNILNSSLLIHYWNKITASYVLPAGGVNVPFLHYARENCPVVFEAVEGKF